MRNSTSAALQRNNSIKCKKKRSVGMSGLSIFDPERDNLQQSVYQHYPNQIIGECIGGLGQFFLKKRHSLSWEMNLKCI